MVGGQEERGERFPGTVTRMLEDLRAGSVEVQDRLFRLVYAELKQLAEGYMRRQPVAHTLQPTALVHEAYLRLMQAASAPRDRAHLLGTAARAMRSILVDLARARRARKRGGERTRVSLAAADPGTRDPTEEILAVHEALGHLNSIDPLLARVVELRFFGGLTVGETAHVLGASERSVYGAWETARALLHERLG
jgi:RNA polymerase sigma factor (TIGR02999 family)